VAGWSTHDGVPVTFPDVPVVKLFYWLATGQWWQLYPNSVSAEETAELRERMFDPADHLDLVHMHDVATRIFGRLSGMAPPGGVGWWPAVRLANAAIAEWPVFYAWCTGRGIDPFAGSLMSAVSAVYAWMRDGLNREQLVRFEQLLWEMPARSRGPAPEPAELPEHVRQDEANAFLAALGESMPGQQPPPAGIM
jgi:hypothetical protein